MTILSQMCLWTRKNWLHFGSHTPLIHEFFFEGLLQHCEHFSTIWLIYGECDRIFVKSQMYRWTRKFPLNFWSNPDPVTRFFLAEVRGLWLLACLPMLWVLHICFHESDTYFSGLNVAKRTVHKCWTGQPQTRYKEMKACKQLSGDFNGTYKNNKTKDSTRKRYFM